jgi:prophage tail gpP-like protein
LSAFPLEYTNANLIAIVNDLCAYHGISVDFQAPGGALFERVDIQPGESILSFLAGLAAQRGPVITSNASGQLVVWNSVSAGAPVGRYEKGYAPLVELKSTINEDQYYSSVTGYTPAKSKRESKGERFTVENPYATDLVCPYTFEATDISKGELETAVEMTAGRMFAAVFSVTAEFATWYTEDGEMFRPNTTIEIKSPDDYIEDFYEFLITEVVLSKSSGVETASLTLALPGAYSGEIADKMPWEPAQLTGGTI